MDRPEQVHRLLTAKTPAPICDDCIAEATDISPRQQVNVITRALGLTTDFDRADGECSVCGNDKLVTRSLRHAHRT